MTTDAAALARELHAVDRARDGDHEAFVELYRQDAPPAWRLALALTADPDLAAEAVSTAFARVLAPASPDVPRSEVPFRLRLLAATRHAVLDGGLAAGGPVADLAVPTDDDRPRPPRAAEVMQAFHQLPERWRTVLWLLTVEGIGTAEAAGVLGIRSDGAAELAGRAAAGLRTQWTRDRLAAGEVDPTAPDHLELQLQTVLPLPMELFAVVERRWRERQAPRRGALGLVLPGGVALPGWAERALLATTGAVIALGITSALVVDRDPDVRRLRGDDLASGTTPTTLSHAESAPEVSALADEEDAPSDDSDDTSPRSTTTTAPGPSLRDLIEQASGGATPATTTTPSTAPAPTTSTTQPTPLLQLNVGIGPTLAVGLGDCTGVELAGQALGCAPDPDTGVHLDGSLVGD